MVWVKIYKIEESQYSNGSYLACFMLHNKDRFVIITKKVLQYLKINNIKVGDEIFVMRSFNNTGDERFLVKKVRGEA